MPKTEVLTGSYVLSHLEHEAHKETLINRNSPDYGMDGMDRSFTKVSDLGDVELEAVLDSAKEHYQEGFKKILEKARVREFACKTRHGSATFRKADHSSRRIRRIDLDHVGAAGRSMISPSNHVLPRAMKRKNQT